MEGCKKDAVGSFRLSERPGRGSTSLENAEEVLEGTEAFTRLMNRRLQPMTVSDIMSINVTSFLKQR